MFRIVLVDPILTTRVNFSNLQADAKFFIFKTFSHLNERRAAATPLMDQSC